MRIEKIKFVTECPHCEFENEIVIAGDDGFSLFSIVRYFFNCAKCDKGIYVKFNLSWNTEKL
jgi:hypothetical protein